MQHDLRDLGSDSLTVTLLAGGLAERLGRQLPVSQVLRAGTLAQLAELIRHADAVPAPAIPPADQAESYPVTPQQHQLYLEQLKDPAAVHYNVPVSLELPPGTDIPPLVRGAAPTRRAARGTAQPLRPGRWRGAAADRAVGRPAGARSSMSPGRPSSGRSIWPAPLVEGGRSIPAGCGSTCTTSSPTGSPWRRCSATCDAVRGRSDPSRRSGTTPPGSTGSARGRRAGVVLASGLRDPARRRRPAGGHPATADPGSGRRCPGVRPRLRAGGLVAQAGPRARCLVVHRARGRYTVLLSKLTGSADILLGTPVSGRTVPGTERMLGMFANTVCLRSQVTPDVSFADFLRSVGRTAEHAFAHRTSRSPTWCRLRARSATTAAHPCSTR